MRKKEKLVFSTLEKILLRKESLTTIELLCLSVMSVFEMMLAVYAFIIWVILQ